MTQKEKANKNRETMDFARKVARAMMALKSSHCHFILQEAYGDKKGKISWEQFEEIMGAIILEEDRENSLKRK